MHLKNFSLLTEQDGMIGLSPAYDLVATKLALPSDPDDTALPINGKKTNLRRNDFRALAENLGIDRPVFDKRLELFAKRLDRMLILVRKSFLSVELQDRFEALLQERSNRLGLISNEPS